MKINDIEQAYYDYTGKFSERTSGLALAGIAVIWIFVTVEESKVAIPPEFSLPLVFLVVTLVSDMLQYLVSGLLYGVCNYRVKKKISDSGRSVKEEEQYILSGKINWAGNLFYWLKAISLIIAYTLLFVGIMERVTFS